MVIYSSMFTGSGDIEYNVDSANEYDQLSNTFARKFDPLWLNIQCHSTCRPAASASCIYQGWFQSIF